MTIAAAPKLLGIQAARGAAALLVVLYHAGRGIALPQYAGHIPFGGAFNFGHAGVDFFFVLSGFVIHFVHHDDLGRPARLWRYARRRLLRIYPIYWMVTALVLLLAVLKPGAAPDAGYLLASLLLLPQAANPLLDVAWTLVHEMAFYLLFATAILSRRLGAAVLALWLALILSGHFMVFQAPVPRLLAATLNLEFMLGVVVAHLALTGRVRRPLWLAAVGMGGFAAAGIAEDAGLFAVAGEASQVCFGLASALILLGLAGAERAGRLRIGAGVAFLGNASYALYLIHTLVIGLAARTLAAAGLAATLPAAVVFAVAVAAAIAAGSALHVLVEQPLQRWLSRQTARQGRMRQAVLF